MIDPRLKTIFNNMFLEFDGELHIDNIKVEEFYNILCEFLSNDVSHCSLLMRNYHYFYSYCCLINELHSDNDIDLQKCYEMIFYILFYVDKRLITHINQIFQKSKKTIQKQTIDIPEFQKLISDQTFKINILNIFFKSFFLDVDPIYIVDIDNFYFSSFNHIILLYLKNHKFNETENITNDIEDSINELLQLQEKNLTKSNRSITYDNALKRVEIDSFLETFDKNSIIYVNIMQLKTQLVENDIQTLFNTLVGMNMKYNPCLTAMISYNTNNEFLNYIESHAPFVYKLIRSVCINSGLQIDNVKFNYIYQHLSDVLYNSLINDNFDPELSDAISKNIAKHFAISFSTKEYLDILTLKKIEIHSPFIWDLRTVLVYLLTGKHKRG